VSCPLLDAGFCFGFCYRCPLRGRKDLAERIKRKLEVCREVVREEDVDTYFAALLLSPVTVEADGLKCDGSIEIGYIPSLKMTTVGIRTCADVLSILNLMDEERVDAKMLDGERGFCYEDGEHRVCVSFPSPVIARLFFVITSFVPFVFVYRAEGSEGTYATFHRLFDVHKSFGGLPPDEALELVRARIYKSLLDDCILDLAEPDLKGILEEFGKASAEEYMRIVDAVERELKTYTGTSKTAYIT